MIQLTKSQIDWVRVDFGVVAIETSIDKQSEILECCNVAEAGLAFRACAYKDPS